MHVGVNLTQVRFGHMACGARFEARIGFVGWRPWGGEFPEGLDLGRSLGRGPEALGGTAATLLAAIQRGTEGATLGAEETKL